MRSYRFARKSSIAHRIDTWKVQAEKNVDDSLWTVFWRERQAFGIRIVDIWQCIQKPHSKRLTSPVSFADCCCCYYFVYVFFYLLLISTSNRKVHNLSFTWHLFLFCGFFFSASFCCSRSHSYVHILCDCWTLAVALITFAPYSIKNEMWNVSSRRRCRSRRRHRRRCVQAFSTNETEHFDAVCEQCDNV